MEDTLKGITYCSIDMNTREGKVLVLNATGEATFKGEAMVGQFMPVKDVIKHMVVVSGDDCERTILVLEDGDTVGFVSEGISKEIDKVISVFGKPTWIPAIEMLVIKVPTKQGSTYNIKVK